MKKATVTFKINVPDDFKVGDCYRCPLCIESTYETHSYSNTSKECSLNFSAITCPLDV